MPESVTLLMPLAKEVALSTVRVAVRLEILFGSVTVGSPEVADCSVEIVPDVSVASFA